MEFQLRRAGTAAIVIALAFCVHLVNMFVFEPRMGFTSVADYATVDKLVVAMKSDAWRASGYAHFVAGWAVIVLAVVGFRTFRTRRPTGAAFVFAFGGLAGLLYLLTAVIDIPGRGMIWMLDAQNPGHTPALIASGAFVRSAVNAAAIVLTGLFVLHFTWAARQTKSLPFLVGSLGYVTGLVGLGVMWTPVAYGLAYLLIPIWAVVLGVVLRTRAVDIAALSAERPK